MKSYTRLQIHHEFPHSLLVPTIRLNPQTLLSPAAEATDFSLLNADMIAEEVRDALKRFNRNKAADIDGIRAEFILNAEDMLLNSLVKAFS